MEQRQSDDKPERLTNERKPGERSFSWDDHFYGAVTVGERGQVVIPAAARKRFDIEPGDKLLIMGDPGKRSLMLCKMDALREFMTIFQEGLARVESELRDSGASAVLTEIEKEEDAR